MVVWTSIPRPLTDASDLHRYQVDEVTIHGKPCPRVDLGRSMRVTLVNVSHVPDAKIGDLVTLHDGCTNGNPFNLASVSIGVPRIPKW